MSEQETTLDEFTPDKGDLPHDGSEVPIGKLQELSSFPIESWKLVKIGDILSLEYGDNLPSRSREKGDVPVYGSNGQVDTHSEAAVDKPGIILGRKGSIDGIEFSEVPFWPIDTTYYVTRDSTDQNLRFLYYLLQIIQIERLNAASAIPGLNRNDAYSLNVVIPPLEEQHKIANILYTVDQAIQNTREVMDITERLKRGILQDTIFDLEGPTVSERRFGPMLFKIPDHWDRVRLKEVTTLVTRGKQPTYADDGIPVVNQECIYWDDFHFENIRYLDEEIGSGWKEKYFPNRGDVLINSTGQGTLGRAQLYRDDVRRAVDSHVTIVRADKKRMMPGYFRYLLESNRGQGLLYSMCVTGSTGQIELSKSKLQLLSIPLPPVDEQEQIVDTIERFDRDIRHKKKYQNKLNRVKRGLMQDLLSGKVRTTEADIEILDEILAHG